MTAYNGTFRTQLSEAERQKLKAIARSKGMTLTGYHDAVMREQLTRNTEHRNRNSVSE